jgi:hypothetical protein
MGQGEVFDGLGLNNGVKHIRFKSRLEACGVDTLWTLLPF